MTDQADKPTPGERFDEAFIADIIEAVRNNTAPWQKSWASGQLISPANAHTGMRYSGRNAVRLALTAQKRGYEDPRWATALQIKEMGGLVKKGEKGTGILFYKEKLIEQEDGKVVRQYFAKHHHVFNIEQTTLPTLSREDIRESTPDLEAFASLMAYHSPKLERGEPAYRPTTDTVYLPLKNEFENEAAYYATALHEMAHWTSHLDRLNRPLNTNPRSNEYAQEELLAELTSYMLSLEYGLPFEPDKSDAYLQYWAQHSGKELSDALQQGFRDAASVKNYLDEPLRMQARAQRQAQEKDTARDNPPQPEMEKPTEHAAADQSRTLQHLLADYQWPEGFSYSFGTLSGSYEYLHVQMEGTPLEMQLIAGNNRQYTLIVDGKKSVSAESAEVKPLLDKALTDLNITAYREATRGELFAVPSAPPATPEKKPQRSGAAAKIPASDKPKKQTVHPSENTATAATESTTTAFLNVFRHSPYDAQTMISERLAKRPLWLAVAWDERKDAKLLGAKWDADAKSWFAPDRSNLADLKRWHILPGDVGGNRSGKSTEDLIQLAHDLGLAVGRMDLTPGKWHRVPLQGRGSGNKDGAYKLFHNADGTIGAIVRNMATGETLNWSDRNGQENRLPPQVVRAAELNREMQAEVQRETTREINHLRAREAAKAWRQLDAVRNDEPYLRNKQISPANTKGLKRLDDGSIVVPLINGERIGGLADSERTFGIVSLQTISPDGEKRLMKDASVSGAYFPIGSPAARTAPTHIVLAEGLATAETVHQLLDGHHRRVLAVAAVNAGNLLPVAQTLAKMYPGAQKIIAADNDIQTEQKTGKNTGVFAAQEVARANGQWTIAIPEALEGKNTDWNDFFVARGKGVATVAFAEAASLTVKKPQAEQNANPVPEKPAVKLPPLDGYCPREIGKLAYQAIDGDIRRLPMLQSALAEVGYQLDTRRFQGINSPVELADAFAKAVVPAHSPKAFQAAKQAELIHQER